MLRENLCGLPRIWTHPHWRDELTNPAQNGYTLTTRAISSMLADGTDRLFSSSYAGQFWVLDLAKWEGWRQSQKDGGIRSVKQVSDRVRKFFEALERGDDGLDLVTTQYNDPFMFAGPQGAQAVKKEDFLKALPKRQGFFKAVGLNASKIQLLEETRLDDNYIMVKAYWQMRFEKDPEHPIVEEISATYILYQQEDLLRIVFQLDHQDLMKRVQELGLLPVKD